MNHPYTDFALYLEEEYGKEVGDRYRELLRSPTYKSAKVRHKNYNKPKKGTPRKRRFA
ncbi:hypothetical protein [Argonema galeatum]|uniref:hypothetical protein n=1 Tax=Argonema galeatum TaxID=2942762 RepID=UPI0020115460|nr:hypothetical protein [Argonema galeatum]MCL1469026.1 hypothetical protein [Argonema galeatum A003/A1]